MFFFRSVACAGAEEQEASGVFRAMLSWSGLGATFIAPKTLTHWLGFFQEQQAPSFSPRISGKLNRQLPALEQTTHPPEPKKKYTSPPTTSQETGEGCKGNKKSGRKPEKVIFFFCLSVSLLSPITAHMAAGGRELVQVQNRRRGGNAGAAVVEAILCFLLGLPDAVDLA